LRFTREWKILLISVVMIAFVLFPLNDPEFLNSVVMAAGKDNIIVCSQDGPEYMPLRPDILDSYLQEKGYAANHETNISDFRKTTIDRTRTPLINDGSIKPDLSGKEHVPPIDDSGKLLSPQIGMKRNLVILIQFPNETFDNGRDANYFHDLVFGSSNSMRDYYYEQSYGQLSITGTVVGPYTSIHPIEYYASDGNGRIDTGINGQPVPIYELAREAVQLAREANPGFNWSEYDLDNNGEIDAVTIIHAGMGQEEVSEEPDTTIWSHQWVVWPWPGESVGAGKFVYTYNMVPETAQLGVLAHEFGHVLGLPDLYDTSNYSEGAGKWELMAGGCWNGINVQADCPAGLSAWSRHYLGWLDYTEPTQDTVEVQIPNINDNAFALRLWTEGADSLAHFLVENRQKTGCDSALPGEGLLVWWVNDPEYWIGQNKVNEYHTMMPLEADGRWDLWKPRYQGNRGDTGDPFPGSTNNTAFTFTSNPDSTGLGGAYTGVSLWNIHQDTVDANLYVADMTVKNGLLLEPRTESTSIMTLDEPFAELKYVLLNDNTLITIDIVNSSGSVVCVLINNERQSKGNHVITWDGKNQSNQLVAPGLYRFRISSTVSNIEEDENEVTYRDILVRTSVAELRSFVTRFYRLCLNREPDVAGLNHWVNLLATGQVTGAQLAQLFVLSDEFSSQNLDDGEYINVMYRTFFDRDADVGGKTFWLSKFDEGLSRMYILASFVSSQEFSAICDNYEINRGYIELSEPRDLNPKVTAFVTRFYINCLGRKPDSSGLNHWVAQLASGQQTGATISEQFIFCPEFTSKNLSNYDFLTVMYRVFFGREPDSGGMEYWLNRMNGMSRRDVMISFIRSGEFAGICSDYGIQVGIIN